MPLFYLYCRSGPGKPWYPVSMMKGDGQSKGLINAWLGSPVAKVEASLILPSKVAHSADACVAHVRQDVFKNRLDSGMAQSIFDSERRLANLAVENYSHMKKLKQQLEWGFKIVDNDVMCDGRCCPCARRA